MTKKPSPKLALRAWRRWRAGQPEFPADLERTAAFVELAIQEVILNAKSPPALARSERNLAARMEAFEAAYRTWKEKPD